MAEKIPVNWIKVKLGDLVEPSKQSIEPTKSKNYSFIGLEHIEKNTGKIIAHGNSQETKSTKIKFNSGDILYGKLRPYLNKVAIPNFDGVCSTDILVFPQQEHIDNVFVYYRLLRKDFVNYASKNMSGVQHPRIKFNTIAKFTIKLPPLPEQHRIVAKIEALFSLLDAGVAELKRIQAQLQTYRQAVLKAAFEGKLTAEWRATQNSPLRRGAGGDVNTPQSAQSLIQQIQSERERQYQESLKKSREEGTPKPKRPKLLPLVDTSELPELPEGWVWEKLGNIATDMCLGKMLDKSKNKGIPKPYLRNVNVRWGNFDLDDLKLMRFEANENERYGIIDGDLIICEGGEPGRAAIWKDQIPNMMIQKALHRVRFTNDFISGRYVLNFLYLSSKNGHLSNFFTGTTIKHLTGKGLSEFSLPITHISEQNQIVQEIESRLSVADNLEQTIKTALQQAEVLRQSILKKAFAGELVPQDPNDEPAEVLLARIREEKEKMETAAKAVKKSKKSPPSKGGKGGC